MENNSIIKCTSVIDDSICTVVLKYKVYRNDSGKLFGKLLALKHKVENFLKEVLDEEILLKNPVLQRTKDGLVDLFQGLTSLCSGISQAREMLTIPELPLDCGKTKSSYEMKFIKGVSSAEMWLCYVDNGEFLNLLKRLSKKYENEELKPFVFYPRVGEHVYFKQGVNIFRGIVQEYVIPDEDDEEHVDVKVLNIDNSDVVVLPQNSFFQMDKEGIELPMQCVCCSSVNNTEKNGIDGPQQSDLSLAMLKKHKLNVTFNCEKINVKGLPLGAQCVTITLSADKLKDKKNSFNVNSKEFVPRNSVPNAMQSAIGILDNDNKSDQTTRSSSPGSSQDDIEKPAEDTTVVPTASSPSLTKKFESKAPVIESEPPINAVDAKRVDSPKEKTENKANVINYCAKNNLPASPIVTQPSVSNSFKSHDKDRPQTYGGKEYRYNSSKINDIKGNKPVSSVTDKMKNTRISSPSHENRTKSGPPSTSSHPSQTQSPANLPPNPPAPPYLFQSVPQFPPGPIHFPGQYVPIPAPQQLNSSMPFHFPQYPYATQTYLQSAPPPPAGHSQYHMPPASTPYQQYMQPVAVGPFFSSQPPFSQQFYQPMHLQQTWSHLQPAFHVSGSPQQAAAAANAGKADVSNNPSMSKFK